MPIYYECQRCTACCRWPGLVRVSEEEIRARAEHLGMDEREFIHQHTRLCPDRRGLSLTERPDGTCVFLDGRDCRVQAVKPRQCRDFPNGWNFPGFQKHCAAKPREVDEIEYARLMGR
jgi:Fe-S-cluster containining protein